MFSKQLFKTNVCYQFYFKDTFQSDKDVMFSKNQLQQMRAVNFACRKYFNQRRNVFQKLVTRNVYYQFCL